jgi:c-di-GMP-binding flagellar brake protein YcgR
MSTGDAQSRQYETRLTEEERRYLVHSVAEIVQILRQACDRAAMLTASFGDGSAFALTSVLEVQPDEDQVLLDMPGQREVVPALLATDLVTLTTQLDGIKIKFQVPGLERAEHDGRDALAAALPESVVRLQRREYFRVPCPMANPPKCAIPHMVRGEARRAEFDVIDVSLGGLALMARPGELAFETGNEIKDCTITLPGEGMFATTLEVRNVRNVELRSGHALRVGCRFITPPADGITRLQRYTMKIERERKAKFA